MWSQYSSQIRHGQWRTCKQLITIKHGNLISQSFMINQHDKDEMQAVVHCPFFTWSVVLIAVTLALLMQIMHMKELLANCKYEKISAIHCLLIPNKPNQTNPNFKPDSKFKAPTIKLSESWRHSYISTILISKIPKIWLKLNIFPWNHFSSATFASV